MKAFRIHDSVVKDYKDYLNSFTFIKDQRIREKVGEAFSRGIFLPEALIQFNPSFKLGASLDDLMKEGIIHPDLKLIFGSYNLYQHQVEAIRKGVNRESFIVTSGTGSGKSLTYLSTIFNQVLKEGPSRGIRAILIYPMNALINSQEEEIKKYEINYLKSFLPFGTRIDEKDKTVDQILSQVKEHTKKRFPITYGKYTGQEDGGKRDTMKVERPNIILTNYMMLELIMTRNSEKWLRESMAEGLEFLVFDELHTYRGRQGSDVSLLIRRIKNLCRKKLTSIGTSATMASNGTVEDRKQAVANVATQIFSYDFTKESIIGESLATCTHFPNSLPDSRQLKEAIRDVISVDGSPEVFTHNILAIWLENRIALHRHDNGFLERGKPHTLKAIAQKLADGSGEEIEVCTKAVLNLLQWTEQLNIDGSRQVPRKSYLPFKIHQFISQTGNVYVTLQTKEEREITLETGRYIRVNGTDRPIYPVLFSRYSGYDFICVRKENGKLIPRSPDDIAVKITKEDLKGDKEAGTAKRVLSEADFPDGYIIIPDKGEAFWIEEDEEYLPESWYNTRRTGGKFDNYYEYRLPRRISFDEDGNFSATDELRVKGWFIPAKLLLDPTSGVIFDLKTNENTKLMRLGNEGRSTATTITSFSIIKALREQQAAVISQKLLSFTDNRQDASLQAGHFNDFLMLGRLRSAIYHALQTAPNNTLDLDTISNEVFKSLSISEEEYARTPSSDPGWPDPENEKAIKDYILLRILYDLKRGWRYNTPNLEQCGLLEITYNRLHEFCSRQQFFEGVDLLKDLSPEKRIVIVTQILNYFRTSYAFEHYKLLDKRAETEERLRNRLDENKLWSLDTDERIETPYVLLAQSVGEADYRVYTASIGPHSYLGKYLRRLFEANGVDRSLIPSGKEMVSYIETVCSRLEKGHFLKSQKVKGKRGEATGYRLRIDQVLWKLGNGTHVVPDEIRVSTFRQVVQKPNEYFKKFYEQDFSTYERPLVGREHTGQLSNADRIDREDKFRRGEIATLFCSPTMELGIDISELNVVHMRNVPPNPANYAQRSGRAGRSGQAALVFTYCSNGSPHDRNYFKDSRKMVAGAVVPAKIDLTNEELILSHFNAYILMELGLGEMQTSVNDVLQVADSASLPIKPHLVNHIEDHISRFALEWSANFKQLITSIPGLPSSYWYAEEWLTSHGKSFLGRFDKSFERWRSLYWSANRMIENARAVMDDPTIGNDNPRKSEAKREHNVGLRQRDLLLNAENRSFGSESEFYVYRYLASEGFLPGYNFTRVPVRAFLGYRHMDKGEFISRPRFVALKEFGPNNLIYHNGGKFRITRMQLSQGDSSNHKMKISKKTGYAFLDEESKAVNNDPITQEQLQGDDTVGYLNNLLELSESDARPQERISCEEEERMSTGFEIEQYFSFAKGVDATRRIIIKEASQPLLQIIYDQSARLIQVNKRWRTSPKQDGFAIGKVSGKWLKAKEIEKPNPDDPPAHVHLFTTGTADILYVQPIRELKLTESGVVSLSYALKRAIEKQFQIEENEVGVWIMGKGEHKNILIYEAAEGSLGILSQLVDNARLLRQIFAESYSLLHFDPFTKEDTRPDEPKASYDNLLSYYNQRYHDQLDRFAVKAALERLLDCSIDNQQGGKSVDEQFEYLKENYDKKSATEHPLIQFLYQNGYILPDRAQFNIPGFFISADFVYKTNAGYSLIFCDGGVHDRPEVKADDLHKRKLLLDAGYDVVEWHYSESIKNLVERRKDVFRKVR